MMDAEKTNMEQLLEASNYLASIEHMRMEIDRLERTVIWYETNSDIEWRRLEKGEEVLAGDQIYQDDIRPHYWITVGQDGCGCKAPDPQYTCHRQYRRSIAPQELRDVKDELDKEATQRKHYQRACLEQSVKIANLTNAQEHQEPKPPSIYDAIGVIQAELTCDMSVTIDEDGTVIQIGSERFEVDASSSQDTEAQVNEFFASATWLSAMRLVDC